MPWQSSELCALDTLEYLLIQSIKKVWEILFSRGEKPLNPAQFATCLPSVFRHSRQANSALSGWKFRAGGPKFCTGPIICTSSKFCLVLDLLKCPGVGYKPVARYYGTLARKMASPKWRRSGSRIEAQITPKYAHNLLIDEYRRVICVFEGHRFSWEVFLAAIPLQVDLLAFTRTAGINASRWLFLSH